jgi:RimJ/RimL family protein N-acetyltransferase
MPNWIKKAGEEISTNTTVAAMNLFHDYTKQHVDFEAPVAEMSFDEAADTKDVEVHINVAYNGTNFHMRSIKAEDHEVVQTYVNSQGVVRAKYANKKTPDAAATKARVKALADRFSPKVTDGCFMNGGFYVSDNDTDSFLGMANSGYSGVAGKTEIAYLFRADAWSNKPAEIVEEFHVPEENRLKKEYKGAGTAVVSSLVQYTKHLKDKGYKIKGADIEAMRATAMIDNPGSWKVLGKAGFVPYDLDANPDYGPEIRYQLELKL